MTSVKEELSSTFQSFRELIAEMRPSPVTQSAVVPSAPVTFNVGLKNGEEVAQAMGYYLYLGDYSKGEEPVDGASLGLSHFKLSLEDVDSLGTIL